MDEPELSIFISDIRRVADNLRKQGYELFGNNEFIEFYFTKILGGKPTNHVSSYDCLLSNGLRLEFKHSKYIEDNPKPSGFLHKYFRWDRLMGTKNPTTHEYAKTGKVDYLVLSGFLKKLYIWVIPFKFVKTSVMETQLYKKNNYRTWISPFYIGDELKLYRCFRDNKFTEQMDLFNDQENKK
jgi:hypothetical protein